MSSRKVPSDYNIQKFIKSSELRSQSASYVKELGLLTMQASKLIDTSVTILRLV